MTILKYLHQIGYMIKSNPESLNKCCHEKFGFEDLIKESTKIEELQWAEKTLPSYTIWDKFSQYHSLVELWINKVNITHMKKKEEDIHTRSEWQQKKSAFGIHKLINIGITFDQLVNTGLDISNFEVTDYYYERFKIGND
ncbi:hypothetical protein RhiirA4_423347 [Rhizophagus irregularis]|uniref:Uncharacterized protein n=1 Tax=Rhizophagus irregularis TaxID=588596 RepID=A0A2I1GTG7_9GLOM|nr:hypothetical protein RhiirA4_423347 [Rhizophagus irregularis]